jgi:RND family efflux transporter MFP subunit
VESRDRNSLPKVIKGLRIAFVLVISLAVAIFFVKTRPHPRQKTIEDVVPLVETIEVRKTSPNMIVKTYGTVRSGENLSLTAEVKGKIVKMAPGFEEGGYFRKGSFLMRIDPRNYALNVEGLNSEMGRLDAESARIIQEQENLQSTRRIAEEDMRLARAEYDRNLSLAKRNVVSQNQVDQKRQRWLVSRQKAQETENALALIKPGIDLLQARRQSVLVQLKEARLALEKTEIRAPFDCRVAKKFVERGQYVMAGTRLANIYNVGIMEVEVNILPREVPWLHFSPEMSVDLKENPPAKARITFDTPVEKLVWDGFVSRIKGQMEESTRTLPVVVQIQNSHPGHGHLILPGMFVTVEIVGKQVEDLFFLPREAVREDGSVYVVKNGEIRLRPVKIVRRVGNHVYVKEGLSDGDQVVTFFPGVASEGMKVRISNSEKGTGNSKEGKP